jgi:hypothetical protein
MEEKKAASSKKTANVAIDLLRDDLADFNKAIKTYEQEKGGLDDYTFQSCNLLENKVKEMMEQALAVHVSGNEVPFSIAEVRQVVGDMNAKKRTL